MFPAFVIHHSSHVERDEVVKDIMTKTNAVMFEAHMLPDKLRGNLMSHIGVAKLAKALHPDSHYIVFEDDCELLEDWTMPLQDVSGIDVIYIGYNDRCSYATFGTHAICLSPRARDLFIEKAAFYGKETDRANACDHVLSRMCREERLPVAMPKYDMKERFCRQKKGLVSTITGEVR